MANPYDSAPAKKVSVLGPTLKFKGELSAEEDLLIQGEVEGSIDHTQSLTVAPGGKVKADVRARYITVEGHVDGNLYGSKAVLIRETGQLAGNIYAPTVSLVDGARFKGKIDMESELAQTGPATAEAKRVSQDAATPRPTGTNAKQIR